MLNPYRIVYPVVHEVNADSYKSAIKNYVKMKNDIGLKQLIITDINNHNSQLANMKYFRHNGIPRVGINMQPYSYTVDAVDYPETNERDHPTLRPVPMLTPFSSGLVIKRELSEDEKLEKKLKEEKEEEERKKFWETHQTKFVNEIGTTITRDGLPRVGLFPTLRIVPKEGY
jgi:hypothetical protein